MGVIEPMLKKHVLANNRPIVSHSQIFFKGVVKLLGCRLERSGLSEEFQSGFQNLS